MKKMIQDRRQFLKNLTMASSALLSGSLFTRCADKQMNKKLFLLRYDTEWWGDWSEMDGFIEKVIEVHRKYSIPASFFCKGETLVNFRAQFREFYKEVKDDPLFDFQDHSYSHIGLGYEKGKSIEVLKEDYERSFQAHKEIFMDQPVGISRCGTSDEGASLNGFDATDKSRAELKMIAGMGVKMIDTFLSGHETSSEFIHYGTLGYPDIMGFPSGYSDTAWMYRREKGDDPVEYITGEITKRSKKNLPMPLMLHDWVAWQHAPDKELSHVVRIVDFARNSGYEPVTHIECYNQERLWRS